MTSTILDREPGEKDGEEEGDGLHRLEHQCEWFGNDPSEEDDEWDDDCLGMLVKVLLRIDNTYISLFVQ